jgi:glycosyltransferase involved in cell wall biosynthesis
MMRQDVKRLSYLLLADALGRLAAREWQLLVVGDGPARAEIEAALERAAPGRVRFAGAVPEAALPGFYAAADLMVWPAVREAYGLAMLEAQAAGLPVVAGREGGVAEVVRDGVTGILTAPRDPAAFAEATERLLRAPGQRQAMGEAAVRFVAQERSLAQAAATLRAALAAAPEIRARR